VQRFGDRRVLTIHAVAKSRVFRRLSAAAGASGAERASRRSPFRSGGIFSIAGRNLAGVLCGAWPNG
jgi:hypothetical protein